MSSTKLGLIPEKGIEKEEIPLEETDQYKKLTKEIAELKKANKVKKEEEEKNYTFESKPWTIRELKEMNVKFKDFFEIEGLSMPMSWDSMIHLCNSRIIKGKKVTEDFTLKEVFPVFQQVVTKNFL